MPANSPTLDADELRRVTGKRQAASQAAVLARLGIPFVFLGRAIRVDRHVAQAFELLKQDNPHPQGVDFSKVR